MQGNSGTVMSEEDMEGLNRPQNWECVLGVQGVQDSL